MTREGVAATASWLDRLVWYNRRGRMSNGIKWFRFGMESPLAGWGLWWKDTRVKGPDPTEDAPANKYRIGPYRVALLRPVRHD